MDHREWRGIGVSDFQRNFLPLSARITSGYVGIDECFGCAGFVWGRNCGGAMSKTFGKFKFRISYADD